MAESTEPRMCPVMHGSIPPSASASNLHWWPDQLNVSALRQNHPRSNPLGEDFDYAEAFKDLDVDELARDVDEVMLDSKDWWPADFGHYGPFFVRMSWHAAGTYRVSDGRGGGGAGAQRFPPTNSWPDNVSLDKARRLLWPVKQKHGQKISWADLIVYAGNRAMEHMGFSTFGFGFGRADVWEPEEDVFWGPESEWLTNERFHGERELDQPLGASEMGLIYVNPQGPDGDPDPLAAAHDIRQTFHRMAMNDEETVALIAGGHTFGKTHGAAPESHKGPDPNAAPITQQGLGWVSDFGAGHGADAVGSGIEITWTPTPTQWDNGFYDMLFKYEWELTQSPAGAHQWQPKGEVDEQDLVPMADDSSSKRPPMMLTTDLSLKEDPGFREISERFHQDLDVFADAFARAWYKLLHRDMGPVERYLGPWVPDEDLLWQDPVPAVDHQLIDDSDVATLKSTILDSGLSISELVITAWASASTYRDTDKRGGANGARIRLSPAAEWDVNVRSGVSSVISKLEELQQDFNDGAGGDKRVSLADMIVLGGCAGVEAAAKAAGHDVTVPFTPGRTDASQEWTDVESYDYLQPVADGFRNYLQKPTSVPAEHHLVDKAFMLTLSVPEMTVLLGGMRVLGANVGDSEHGVFTDRPGKLTNDFFVNLLDMSTVWSAIGEGEETFEGRSRESGELRWTATRADLIFGHNSELRAVAEVYGSDDAEPKLVADFVAAWDKVMNLDRFDLD